MWFITRDGNIRGFEEQIRTVEFHEFHHRIELLPVLIACILKRTPKYGICKFQALANGTNDKTDINSSIQFFFFFWSKRIIYFSILIICLITAFNYTHTPKIKLRNCL